MQERQRIIICGAAGRDYHNFNTVYRDNQNVEVVAFTATQIPGIDKKTYPAALAGSLYPRGIPVLPEWQLETLITNLRADEVVFAYSDVSHRQVMHLASRVISCGANFTLLGPQQTMVKSSKPVIAVSAVRTGCGKSQIARYIAKNLRERGQRVAAIRHPMPYGQLEQQAVQRFATTQDIDAANCTLEEREEYEPHVAAGNVVFAGVDYAAITAAAEAEADVIVWDGGNNDFPFLEPDVHIVVTDALRPDQLCTHHPGEAVLRMADIVVINKVSTAGAAAVAEIRNTLDLLIPHVPVVPANSPVHLTTAIKPGSKVLIVEDGPTITHGGMPHGSGWQSVLGLDVTIVNPRASAPPAILKVYEAFPHIGRVLPAMGYDKDQLAALRQTINDSAADVIIAGTPINLARDAGVSKPVVRALYNYNDAGEPLLMELIESTLASSDI